MNLRLLFSTITLTLFFCFQPPPPTQAMPFYKISSTGPGEWLPSDSQPVSLAPSDLALLDGQFVVRIYYRDPRDILLLGAFDVFEYHNQQEGYWLAAVDQAGMQKLNALGLRVEVDPLQSANFNLLPAPLSSLPDPEQVLSIPNFPCYRTVEETYQSAQGLASAYPHLVSWVDIGDSWEKSVGQADGYDLMALRLGNDQVPGWLADGRKPTLLLTASIHAREYTPAELATRFAEILLFNYGKDPDATWLLDQHEIHLVLVANPDGRKEAEAGISWRKNTNENYCGITSLYRGADLNRNFDYMWGGVGASTNPCDITYRGASAASEPETQAIQGYMKSIFPDQREEGAAPLDTMGVYIDLHSYAEQVLWPWGYTTSPTLNSAGLQSLGRKLAFFNEYEAGQSGADLYLTSGDTIDYAYGELGIAAYTIELGTAFFQDCASFENTILIDNLQTLLYAAKAAHSPYLLSMGPDARSVTIEPASVEQGALVTLSSLLDDTRYSDKNEPVQNIIAGEFYLDSPPWQGGTPYPLSAEDGAFDETKEAAYAAIDTSSLGDGRHLVYVRGQDTAGNWGVFSAAFLEVDAPGSVIILNFSAQGEPGGIRLGWETASEVDLVGFNLYREVMGSGVQTQVNSDLIPALNPGSTDGNPYEYLDSAAELGMAYTYWLEYLDTQGSLHVYGSVDILFGGQQLFLPLVIK